MVKYFKKFGIFPNQSPETFPDLEDPETHNDLQTIEDFQTIKDLEIFEDPETIKGRSHSKKNKPKMAYSRDLLKWHCGNMA